MKPKISSLSLLQANKMNQFFSMAYADYIAARVLFNSCLLLQGAIFASTSIEKYIKAFLALHGNESRGHLKNAHWNALENHSKTIASKINKDFFELCQKSYQLRYLDDLPVDFNLVIAQLEFLIELDRTIEIIEKSIKMRIEGQEQERPFDHAVNVQDLRLFQNNLTLNKIEPKNIHPDTIQMIYEIRNCRHRGFIELSYSTKSAALRPGFLRDGCVTKDGKTYQMAFPTISEKIKVARVFQKAK